MNVYIVTISGEPHRTAYASLSAIQKEFPNVNYQTLSRAISKPAGMHADILPDHRVIVFYRMDFAKIIRKGSGFAKHK